LIQHVDKMLVLDAGKAQHYGPAADVMRAMAEKAQAAPAPAGVGAQVVAMARMPHQVVPGSARAAQMGAT
jgi:ABC-type protease/lipase transport system fused ATPase/permease subunit